MSNENENVSNNEQKQASEAASAPTENVSGEAPAKPVPKKPVPKAATGEGGAAPAPKKEAEPPQPGKYCKLLMENGFHPEPLGNDCGGVEMILVKNEELQQAARFIRDNQNGLFDLLVSISGVDWGQYRQAVYHVYSTRRFETVCLKTNADADEKIPSVVDVWKTADWHEREAYDLFGIIFEGHPNLKRILLPIDWIGYPMRKDYVQNDPRLVWNER